MPQAVEQLFEKDFPGLAGVKVRGKVDRIDLNGTTAEMIDFKSGKLPSTYRRAVKLGWQIQAVLYPWLGDKPGAAFRFHISVFPAIPRLTGCQGGYSYPPSRLGGTATPELRMGSLGAFAFGA